MGSKTWHQDSPREIARSYYRVREVPSLTKILQEALEYS